MSGHHIIFGFQLWKEITTEKDIELFMPQTHWAHRIEGNQ